jgi:predicted lipoprotein with Yx(FWY)xxD motif
MIRRTSLTRIAGLALTPLVALALASCDDGSSADSSSTAMTATRQPAAAASAGSGTVAVGTTDLGPVLVDSKGMTLYLFQADKGTTSSCNDTCATAWPPLQASAQPTAGSGADSSLLGTTRRSDGTSQVTYNGHPVYTFAEDSKAGDANGEGVNAFGGAWYVLSASGDQITSAAPTSSG